MRINHNLASLNTYRQLTTNSSQGSKSLEKLSSGLRINKAGDDAAGLAISEKMRSQIRGLDQASRNAQDGISLVQTAEGALSETQSILQRMREVADQSANGTLNSDDRSALQDEVKQLKSEIDRIGNSTEFNTKKLLNGALAGTGSDPSAKVSSATVFKGSKGNFCTTGCVCICGGRIDYGQTDALMIDGKKIDINWSKYLTTEDKAIIGKNYAGVTANETTKAAEVLEKVINMAIDDSGSGAGHVSVTEQACGAFKIESSTKGTGSVIETYVGNTGCGSAKLADGSTLVLGSNSVMDVWFGSAGELCGTGVATHGCWATLTATTAGDTFTVTYNGQRFQSTVGGVAAGSSLSCLALDFQNAINCSITCWNGKAGLCSTDDGFLEDVVVKATDDGRLTFEAPSGDLTLSEEVGKTILDDQGLSQASVEAAGQGAVTFQIGSNKGQSLALSINDMRTSALGVGSVDVSSSAGAAASITTIDAALKKVSSERGKLGAVQNRLEHTINNLNTSSENLTAAESRIRDVDMAKEMMDFTKNNILSQAAQSMLAQANQQPQGVLQLLR